MELPLDINSNEVNVGARVKLLKLSGNWFDELPNDEKADVASMINEIFEVEEIDEYGKPWIRKSWPNLKEGECHSHSIALERDEMELIKA